MREIDATYVRMYGRAWMLACMHGDKCGCDVREHDLCNTAACPTFSFCWDFQVCLSVIRKTIPGNIDSAVKRNH